VAQLGLPNVRNALGSPQSTSFLVVDDFPTMRRAIKNVLQDLGYTNVTEADDGIAALPLLKHGNFDFLITDWNMPGMSGLELLRQVRADEGLAKLPVLMLTAEAERARIVKAMQAGVTGYMVKPFTTSALREKIAKMLSVDDGSMDRAAVEE
jgi:two-component system chemotaxis response regulator CheY